ncbi:response regulator [Anthocerotibacter panamensis]|uniref:response regulator n=1 Tax=Anthocerotibacter panamensis TaxID=2857077 RepID=UPI001C404234|nr:response regulator [Anthocerotibacter panamensis]
MRILLADNDEQMVGLLAKTLAAQRYLVDMVNDGQEAWDFIETTSYDLVLLDVLLPTVDGISLCRRLRDQGYQMPVLLLTARDSATDKILGLDAGADDYMIKPLDLGELTARLRALLRRGGQALPPVLAWEALRLDPGTCKVSYAGKPLLLSPKEYSLLELFLRHPRRVFSRGCILDHLWSYEELPTEDTVKAHIKGIRQKLKAVSAPSDIIETVYGLGYRLKPPDLIPEPPPALAGAWERFQAGVLDRVGVLEAANHALLGGTLIPALRQQAGQEAHKLAGLLGTFGLHEGTRLARQIEEQIQDPIQDREQLLHFTELVVALRREVERTTPAPDPTLPPRCPRVLAVTPDLELVANLGIADSQRVWESCPSSAQARAMQQRPDIVLLDLSEPTGDMGEALALLAELATATPIVPVVVLTDHQDLAQRVEVTRLGSRALIQKPAAVAEILKTVEQALPPARTPYRVLILDDDTELLAMLRTLLEPWGLKLATLSDSLRFWKVLEEFTPDLLVLDVEMPHLGGIDLCRVVRNDPRWQSLPVLFLTAHTDADTVQRVFAGGADDLVSKPVTGPDLAMRILNRLERTRLLRR